jgi:hypothetical protein
MKENRKVINTGTQRKNNLKNKMSSKLIWIVNWNC